MSTFYLEYLDHCQAHQCVRPAEVEVMRSGKVSYGKFCKSHGKKHMKDLEKSYAEKQP